MLCVPWQLPRALVDLLPDHTYQPYPSTESTHPELDATKRQQIPSYKLLHGDRAWKLAVDRVDCPAKIATADGPPPVSRAYFKLVELIRTCAIRCPRQSLHLCDAPGGFAQAVLDEFPATLGVSVMSVRGKATPYFAPLLLHNDRVHVLKLSNDANICSEAVRREIAEGDNERGFELITADGAFDNDRQPEATESASASLVACEIETALRVQQEGGVFVLKVFGMACPATKELVAVLCAAYDAVFVTKPSTSRSVNDERYIVCQGFCAAKCPFFRVGGERPGMYLHHVATVDPAWMREADRVSMQMAETQRLSICKAVSCTSACASTGRRGSSAGSVRRPRTAASFRLGAREVANSEPRTLSRGSMKR